MADGEEDTLELEAEGGEQQQGEPESGDLEEGEPEIFFGEEAAPASGEQDSALIRHLREQLRDQGRRLAEAERRVPKVDPGPEPTLESCGYDEVEYKQQLRRWDEATAAQAQEQSQAETVAEQARQEFVQDEQRHLIARAALTFKDVDEAESVALAALNPVQQATIKMAAGNAATLLYALGKHPGRLSEISKIQNPVKLAAAVAKLELSLKVKAMPRPAVSGPEEISAGSAGVGLKGSDKHLESLEREAERTGDRTKVIAYKKSLRQAG